MDMLAASLKTLLVPLVDLLPRVAVALLVLAAALFLASRLGRLANHALLRVHGLPASAVSLLTSVVNFAVLLLGILAALQVLGLGQLVYSTIASLGVVGLIVGFALQDITKQFASGVMLLLARPFEIGDTIKVGIHEGTVVELQLRITRLKTAGGDEVLIPNADVYIATVYNMSRYPQRRFSVPLQLPFANNLEAIHGQLVAAVAAIQGVSPAPKPTVAYTAVVDGKVSAEVRYWIDTATPNQDEVITRVIVAANRVLAE